ELSQDELDAISEAAGLAPQRA
ncbi:MAG: hypothetical protein QOK21_2692, partial [Solirubrobacteraceae bacterium]|nr:hypothetical protein [Solirubrobacteraceae bacterium]